MQTLLDCQSHFSLLWGTASPEALLERAAELGYRAVAITDCAGLYSLPRLVAQADALPCRPMLGASLSLGRPGSMVVILVEDEPGYRHLCRLLTRWHAARTDDRSPPLASTPDLKTVLGEDTDGLLFLTDHQPTLAWLREREAACYFRVGPGLGRPPDWVGALDLTPVFAPAVCMRRPGEHALHRLLRAIALRVPLADVPAGACAPPEAFLQPPAAYRERYSIFRRAMAASEGVAERARFWPAPRLCFPPAPDPDAPALQTLRERAYAGAEERFGELSESVVSRLDYELDLIAAKGFAEYFLVVADIVSLSPRICGRGSGAASLVNYCLGVTNVDPLRHHLMFERFLNPGREDPPDIDVDFAWDERDDVLRDVFARYGADRAAMVANHLTFQPRMAVRETARAFGLSDEEIGAGLAHLPELRDETTPAPVIRRRAHASGPPQRVRLAAPWPAILGLARQLVGLPRMLSLHCGGLVIVPDAVADHVPVEPSAKGFPMIQWEKDGTETMGLVKIDLLGNRSLAVIRDAVADVARTTGAPAAEVLPAEPADDPATQALLSRGRSMGIFYVESPAMRLLQEKAGRGDFGHLVIHSSIIRPAANRYIQEYLARLHGKPWTPLHPRLAGVFDETYGVPVFQEDVCKLTMALAGFDAARADQLRKCLGKRDAARRLDAHKGAFFAGGARLGVPRATRATAWDAILSMTGYSFCKPHSASYAQVSFEAAFLKAHFPAPFLAAVLANGGGYYAPQAYVSEALRLGLRIRGPCVNRSAWRYQAEDGGIRVGLMAVRDLRQQAAEAVLQAREHGGPFRHLADFCRRTGLPPEDLHRLGVLGALDALAPELNRPQILWLVHQDKRLRAPQGELFPAPVRVPDLPPFTHAQRQEVEYAGLGFLLGSHPLALYEDRIRPLRTDLVSSCAIGRHVGARITLLGWPVTGKVVNTRHREPMEFFSFEDQEGLYETILFPKAYARYARLLEVAQPLLVTGTVQREWGVCSVCVARVAALPNEPARAVRVA